MNRTVVYLIRHATTAMVGRGLTGWLPGISLDDNGRRQAEKLAERLRSVSLAAIYSSPLERAVETAQPLARDKGLAIRENAAFGEINFGGWQGKLFPEIEKDPRWRSFTDFRSCTSAPQGEMMLETQARFARGLFEAAAAHPNAGIAIFSHADAIKSVLAHLLAIPIDFHRRLEISPASVTIVELYPEFPLVRSINNSENIFAV